MEDGERSDKPNQSDENGTRVKAKFFPGRDLELSSNSETNITRRYEYSQPTDPLFSKQVFHQNTLYTK